MFIQSHNITDMAQLVRTIESINEKYKDLADNIKKAERRLDTLYSRSISNWNMSKIASIKQIYS